MKGNRNDAATGELGEGDDAVLHDVTGAAGAVGGDGEVEVAAGESGEFAEGLRAAAAGGAADGDDTEAGKDAGEEATVAAGTDHGGEAGGATAFMDVAEVNAHGKSEAVVPDAINGGAGRRLAEVTGAVGPAFAQGEGEKAEQEMENDGDEALRQGGLMRDDDL